MFKHVYCEANFFDYKIKAANYNQQNDESNIDVGLLRGRQLVCLLLKSCFVIMNL